MRSFSAILGLALCVGCGAAPKSVGVAAPEIITNPAGEAWRQFTLENGTLVLAEMRLRAVITVTPVDYASAGVPVPELLDLAVEAPSDGRFCPLTSHPVPVASMVPPPGWSGPDRAAVFHVFDEETSGGVIVHVKDGVGTVVCGRWRDEFDDDMRGLLKDIADKVQKRR